MSHPLPCVHGQRHRTRHPQGPHGQRKRKRGSRHRVHSTPRARQQVAHASTERTAGARALPSLRQAAAARVRPAPASAARAMHVSTSGQRVCLAAAATGIAPPARARPTDALPARSNRIASACAPASCAGAACWDAGASMAWCCAAPMPGIGWCPACTDAAAPAAWLAHIGCASGSWHQRLISGATSISATASTASDCNTRWWRSERSIRRV